jgi:ribonuclease HII
MPKAFDSLAHLRHRFVTQARALDAATESALREDARPGARAILDAVAKRRWANRSEGQRLRHLLHYEVAVWKTGIHLIAGVDEAGMSPLAGPVAAAAVIFSPGSRIVGVDDSKKLDASSRASLAEEIRATAVAWSVGFAEVCEIDEINIYWAGMLAMRRALDGLHREPQHVLIDGRRLREWHTPQQKIIGGDGKSLTIAAASILAKTARDELMISLDAIYPEYGFARHKGYPVREHRIALKKFGPSPVHRRSFAAVRDVLGLPPLPPWPKPEPTQAAQ